VACYVENKDKTKTTCVGVWDFTLFGIRVCQTDNKSCRVGGGASGYDRSALDYHMGIYRFTKMQNIVLLAVFVCALLPCYVRPMKTYCDTDKTSQTHYGIGKCYCNIL